MKQPTVAELLATIARLEERIKQLEARPAVRVEHHHYQHQPIRMPALSPTVDPFSPPWTITCQASQ